MTGSPTHPGSVSRSRFVQAVVLGRSLFRVGSGSTRECYAPVRIPNSKACFSGPRSHRGDPGGEPAGGAYARTSSPRHPRGLERAARTVRRPCHLQLDSWLDFVWAGRDQVARCGVGPARSELALYRRTINDPTCPSAPRSASLTRNCNRPKRRKRQNVGSCRVRRCPALRAIEPPPKTPQNPAGNGKF